MLEPAIARRAPHSAKDTCRTPNSILTTFRALSDRSNRVLVPTNHLIRRWFRDAGKTSVAFRRFPIAIVTVSAPMAIIVTIRKAAIRRHGLFVAPCERSARSRPVIVATGSTVPRSRLSDQKNECRDVTAKSIAENPAEVKAALRCRDGDRARMR
jgi:hypothetical protein